MALVNSVENTILFRRLKSLRKRSRAQSIVAENIAMLCGEAADRMKQMPAFHPGFTLHDSAHLLRVTELMAMAGGATIAAMNRSEIALLILAAHFHDLGMVPDPAEMVRIRGLEAFELHRQLWISEHPNVGEIEAQLAANGNGARTGELALKRAELEQAMWSDYLRITHADRSAAIVRETLSGDGRLGPDRAALADILAEVCASHAKAPQALGELPCDRLVGTEAVNVRFLAVLLRLADILDFDRELTPDTLFRTIHFTSEVSLREWEKHRGVEGWIIGPEELRFEMEFEHPVYERAARQFLDWIDAEVGAAHELVREFPARFNRYRLPLPARVDRSRIRPRGNAYIYHDLEFSLSRDEVVKLLMTDQLYGTPSLCVRELLQNSLDALRYRQALFRLDGAREWGEGAVEFEHGVDADGCEFLQCRDNGAGMDEQIILSFLTKVGRSFYRSPYFEMERIRFRSKGADFDPCSQFGIGFMSCFMLGDRIRIETRRDYGAGKAYGKPLIVEINGLSGLLTIRPGPSSFAPGTKVTIKLRPQVVRPGATPQELTLIGTLQEYALAVEYPIRAECTIPEQRAKVSITPEVTCPPSFLELMGIRGLVRMVQDISDVEPTGLVKGVVAESFLADREGRIVLENEEGDWFRADKWQFGGTSLAHEPLGNLYRFSDRPVLIDPANENRFDSRVVARKCICADGIMVSAWGGGPQTLVLAGGGRPQIAPAYLVDARGSAKPRLRPDRTLRESAEAVDRAVELATGRIWARLVSLLPDRMSHDTWWKLTTIYQDPFGTLPQSLVWSKVSIAVSALESGPVMYIPLQTVGSVKVTERYGEVITEAGYSVHDLCQGLLAVFGEVRLESGRLRVKIAPPSKPDEVCGGTGYGKLSRFPFRGRLERCLCASRGSMTYLNTEHPLLQDRDTTEEFDHFWSALLEADPAVAEPDGYILQRRHSAGQAYLAVDWDEVEPRLRPPYRMYSEERQWSELTDSDLRAWAELDVRE